MNKKTIRIISLLAVVCLIFGLSSCGSEEKITGKIKAYATEDGSGMEVVFDQITKVSENGNNYMSEDIEKVKKTNKIINNVASKKNTIGYTSLGTVDNSVKVLEVDGYEADADNIKAGSYALQTNLNLVTSGEISKTAQDFIDYILSDDGQKIIEKENYVPINDEEVQRTYKGNNVSGSLTISGSSTMAPLLLTLAEKYTKINSKVDINIKTSSTSEGLSGIMDGKCDIAMASRDLEPVEMKAGVTSNVIAIDGIAIIVNNSNDLNNISLDDLKGIYTGDITKWQQIGKKSK